MVYSRDSLKEKNNLMYLKHCEKFIGKHILKLKIISNYANLQSCLQGISLYVSIKGGGLIMLDC